MKIFSKSRTIYMAIDINTSTIRFLEATTFMKDETLFIFGIIESEPGKIHQAFRNKPSLGQFKKWVASL